MMMMMMIIIIIIIIVVATPNSFIIREREKSEILPGIFFGGFTKFRKATISFVMYISPSFCPHGTTRLPLDEFL